MTQQDTPPGEQSSLSAGQSFEAMPTQRVGEKRSVGGRRHVDDDGSGDVELAEIFDPPREQLLARQLICGLEEQVLVFHAPV